jgi:hypothetical protein
VILTEINMERIPCTFIFRPADTVEGRPIDYLCSPSASRLSGLLGQVTKETATLVEKLPAGVTVQPVGGERIARDEAGDSFLVSTVAVLGESLLVVDDPRCASRPDLTRSACLTRLWEADPRSAPAGSG